MSPVDRLIQQFLDDPKRLSEAELARLVAELRSRPALAELLKEHLVTDELLSQRLSADRQDFVARVEQRVLNAEIAPTPPRRTPRPPSRAKTNGHGSPLQPAEGLPPLGTQNHSSMPVSDPLTSERGEESWSEEANPESAEPSSPPHPQSPSPAMTGEERRKAASPGGRLLIAGACVAAVMAAVLLWLESTPAARRVAIVADVSGTVLVERDGVGYRVTAKMPVVPGDRFESLADATMSVRYLDYTTLTLAGDSAASFATNDDAHGKNIFLHRGRLEAEVTAQPTNRPLTLHTPTSVVIVQGTKFSLHVDADSTKVEVSAGRVAVRARHMPADAKPQVVVTGQRAIVTDDGLQIEVGPWPSDPRALVFRLPPTAEQVWDTAEGLRIYAEAVGGRYVLRPRRHAELSESGRLNLTDGAFLVENQAADDWLTACQASDELTIELTLQAAAVRQSGPARILAFSTSGDADNIELVQDGNQILLRLITSTTLSGSGIPLFRLMDTESHHLVVTYRPGELRCVLDGVVVLDAQEPTGDLSPWTQQHLTFGNDWIGDKPWRGTLAGIALYSRALSAEEATRNALHYRLQDWTATSDRP